MVKNKKGWVRVIEVFISITLIAGIVLIFAAKNLDGRDLSEEYSSMEFSIIKQIRINETLRDEVLYASVPTNWSDFESQGLTGVSNKINDEKFSVLECEAKICSMNDLCGQDSNITGNVYAQAGIFSANLEVYGPRQLKIFCWEKD